MQTFELKRCRQKLSKTCSNTIFKNPMREFVGTHSLEYAIEYRSDIPETVLGTFSMNCVPEQLNYLNFVMN